MRHADADRDFYIRDKFFYAVNRDIKVVCLEIIHKSMYVAIYFLAAVPDTKLVKLHPVNVRVHLISIYAKLKRGSKRGDDGIHGFGFIKEAKIHKIIYIYIDDHTAYALLHPLRQSKITAKPR